MINQELFEYWLQKHQHLYIYCKTDEMYGLPNYLLQEPIVNLHIGLNMKVAIPDMKVFKGRWAGTLCFSRRNHHINCPLSTIVQVIGETYEGEQIREYPFEGIPFEKYPPEKKPVDKLIGSGFEEQNLPDGRKNNVITVDFRNRCRSF